MSRGPRSRRGCEPRRAVRPGVTGGGAGDGPPAGAERGRGQGRPGGAVLRPRLRLRRHPAFAQPARPSDAARRARDRDAVPRRLVDVDLHRLGHELARSRDHPGAVAAVRADGGRPLRHDGDPRGLRPARAGLCHRLRGDPGRAQPLHAGRAVAAAAREFPQLPAHHHLARGCRGVLDRGRARRGDRPAAPLGPRPRARICLAGDRLRRPRPRPLQHPGLGRRGPPHRRAMRPVHHHRAGRIDPDDRRQLRRGRLEPGDAGGLRRGAARHHRDVVALFQRLRRPRRAPRPACRGPGPHRPADLHLHPPAHRRRHHRLGGGGRDRPRPPAAEGGDRSRGGRGRRHRPVPRRQHAVPPRPMGDLAGALSGRDGRPRRPGPRRAASDAGHAGPAHLRHAGRGRGVERHPPERVVEEGPEQD